MKPELRAQLPATYRAYVTAYRNADALYWYMFERWRNEPALYHAYVKPVIDKKFGVAFELA